MKVAHSSTTSTDTLPVRNPGASGHQAQLRSIDWNGHIPHAPRGPVSLTAAQVREQLAATDGGDWDNKPILPPFPGQRRSPEQPAPKVPGQRSSVYDDVVLGDRYNDNFANGCF